MNSVPHNKIATYVSLRFISFLSFLVFVVVMTFLSFSYEKNDQSDLLVGTIPKMTSKILFNQINCIQPWGNIGIPK